MSRKPFQPPKAYQNAGFLGGRGARGLRILAEYLEPESRFDEYEIRDTIVFFGSARAAPRDVAAAALETAKGGAGDVERARARLAMARYYEDTRALARRLTEWSKALEGTERRFVVCTGGGPGIMEAANRGASEAKGLNVGLGISLPGEAAGNPYVTRNLAFEFHYFFMRKFWFTYLAKAMVVMPGGFGTLDELFEVLTLIQTAKMTKLLPIVLYGADYWDAVVDFDALARFGVIGGTDLDLVFRTDSVDEAFDFITCELAAYALAAPGPSL